MVQNLLGKTSVYFIIMWLLIVYGSNSCANQKEIPRVESKTIPVGKGPDALFLTPDENYLYVANVEDSFTSVVDTEKDEVGQTINSVNYPWGFTRLGKGNLVAISGWDKGIDVIDFTQHKIVRQKSYEYNLGGITSTKDGKAIFVVGTELNKAFRVDAATLEIVDEYQTGNGPDGIGISKDDSKIYVTNTKDGTISIIQVNSKQTKTIKVGGKPELIYANQDHSLLFISNFFENKIHILNTESDEIIHEISGLDGPEEAVLSGAEELLYVVNFNSSKVYVYDAKMYEKQPEEYTVGTKPIGLVHAINNKKLYVSNYGDNDISVVNLNE